MDYSLEPMGTDHRKPVIDIYNHYIEKSWAAYPDEPVGYGLYDRFLEMVRGYPSVVVKAESGQVVGFAFLRAFLPAATFSRTAEITYFILPDHTHRGIGRTILENFEKEAVKAGVDILLASISSRNGLSLEFHKKYGFAECGRLRSVGRKFGEDFDVVWMQKMIGGSMPSGR
jgi:L-amino acid N-acyltransferase YncA